MDKRSMHISQYIKAPRSKIYEMLINPDMLAEWKVPDGMTLHVHEFSGKEGGTFRISLTYDDQARSGKTAGHTDTYHGQFLQLIPDEKVVEEDEFETSNPLLQGKMRITLTLSEAVGGTNVDAVHEGLPPGVSIEDNQVGWQMSLDKLAKIVENP